jgi:hypothetical protein
MNRKLLLVTLALTICALVYTRAPVTFDRYAITLKQTAAHPVQEFADAAAGKYKFHTVSPVFGALDVYYTAGSVRIMHEQKNVFIYSFCNKLECSIPCKVICIWSSILHQANRSTKQHLELFRRSKII